MLKNVIIVCDYGYIEGGAARIAQETAIALKNEGLRVIFFCAVSPVAEELQTAGVEVVCLNQKDILHEKKWKGVLRGLYNKTAKKEFSKVLNALQPEETVIHVHTWTKGISSSIFKVADKKKFQTLITVHDYFLICPNGGLFDYPKRKICQKKPMSLGCIACNCDARNYFQKLFRVLRQKRQNRNIRKRKNLSYIFISEFSKREFFKRYNKIPESKQYFLKNTVQFEKERFRIACENNRTYLFIGGLTEVKGVRIFCEAVTKAQVKAIVVGQGILGEELKEKYPDIEFVGWKSKGEMTPYLKQTRSLIFPSLWYEAAPLTPLEVMAYGVPVICSDWNAGSEYIKHGENGWLYHGDSVEELIACLRDCSDEEIEKASKNAFENFDEIGLSKATYVKNLLEIYNKVLSVSIFNGEKTMIKKVKPATVDRIVYSFIGIFFVWILLTLDYSKSNLWVVLTFLLIGGFSFYQIITSEKNITLKRIFYIFVFIFMFFAPLQQYLSGTVLWKSTGAKLWYSDQEYLYANLLISLFLLLFERSYEVAEYRDKPKNPMFQPVDTARSSAYKFTVVVLNVVSVLVCVWLLVSGNILGRAGIDFISFKNLSDQIVRILRYFPVCCLLFSVSLWQIKKIRYSKSVFLYAVESLFIYFPFYGSVSRFLLFGAYLSVGSLFFYRFRYKSVYFLIFVVGFFIVFSAFNFFKSHTLSEWYKFSLEIVDFKTPDYDAYQIFMATVKYTALKGVCWGKNLLTAIACMIPRRVWGSKMLPSGEVVLRYFQSNFTNVSCPWFAEFYFAFGSWGVLLGAIVTGFLCKYFDGFYDRGSVFLRSVFCVLTGLFIYILRGALLSAFSYTVALLVPLVLIYLTEKFFLFFVKRREKIEG